MVVHRPVHVADVGPEQLVAGLGGEHAEGEEGGGGGGGAQQAPQDPAGEGEAPHQKEEPQHDEHRHHRVLIEQDVQQGQQVAQIVPPQRHPVDGDLHEVGEQPDAREGGEEQPHIEAEACEGAEAPAQHHAAPGEVVVLGPKARPEQEFPQLEHHEAVEQHEGEVAEQQAACHPGAVASAQPRQQGLEHGGAHQQHQQQAGHQVEEVETALRQGLEDLAVFGALRPVCQQQPDAQLVAAVQGVVGGAQGAVEAQGAALLAALLALVHRLAQLIDAHPFVVEQLHPHLVSLLQGFEQLPLAAHHQIEAPVVTFVEQAVAIEGRDGLIRRAQNEGGGTPEPADGVEQRQGEGQQQQGGQQTQQQPGQGLGGGAVAGDGGIHKGSSLERSWQRRLPLF